MFSPKYLTRLPRNVFQESHAACLGSQMLQILDFIENFMPIHIWYGGNLSASPRKGSILKFNDFFLKKIGNIIALKRMIDEIDQFFSGVFIAIKNEKNEKNVIWIDTEDPEFRSLDIEGVILEIRTFDTAYFELYSDEYWLIKKISDNFHAEIEQLAS